MTGVTGSVDAERADGEEPPERIRIGIAEYAVGGAETALVTAGLGSCVGVALHDPDAELGGLVHVMLPAAEEGTGGPEGKYADTGVAALVAALVDRGADAGALRAKLAGGSDMLDLGGAGGGVGDRNAAAIRAALDAHDVPVVATDLGGDAGRTLVFHPGSGRLDVRSGGGVDRL